MVLEQKRRAKKWSRQIGQFRRPKLNPSTIDFGILSSAGNLWWRVPQATVRQKLGNFEILASAMKHRTIVNEREDRMPWILSRVAYSNGFLGEKGMLALGAGYRHADYGVDNSEDTDRWLVCGEFRYKYNALTLKGEIMMTITATGLQHQYATSSNTNT